MTKSRSPFLTLDPGLKLYCSRKPGTRARRSTDSYGSVVPVYSRYCVTWRWKGLATVTSAGGGGANALTRALQPPTGRSAAIATIEPTARIRSRRCTSMALRVAWCLGIRRWQDVAPVGALAHLLDCLR